MGGILPEFSQSLPLGRSAWQPLSQLASGSGLHRENRGPQAPLLQARQRLSERSAARGENAGRHPGEMHLHSWGGLRIASSTLLSCQIRELWASETSGRGRATEESDGQTPSACGSIIRRFTHGSLGQFV